MNDYKYYCEICDDDITGIEVEEYRKYLYKTDIVKIKQKVVYCNNCNQEIDCLDIERLDSKLRKAYRLNHKLLTPQEIKEIRNKYELSQKDFASILGISNKSLSSYENGSVQDKAIDNLIRGASNPDFLLSLLGDEFDKSIRLPYYCSVTDIMLLAIYYSNAYDERVINLISCLFCVYLHTKGYKVDHVKFYSINNDVINYDIHNILSLKIKAEDITVLHIYNYIKTNDIEVLKQIIFRVNNYNEIIKDIKSYLLLDNSIDYERIKYQIRHLV